MTEEVKIKIPDVITVGEFAQRINLPVSKVIAELMKSGVLATINDNIDYETAEIVAEYLGIDIEKEILETKKAETKVVKDDKELVERPPVVAVMGHVDHGKTSILDAIRETDIVAGEAGGITQHIGAYQIERKGKKITFLDTPGHEAFEAMRQHGANITDIALIVVAADDGVKPQTIEAVNHARNANTTIITVINKIDKPEANLDKVKGELSEIGLTPEDWGGKTVTVPVSAKAKTGLDDLLEMILLQADVLELKANPEEGGQGVVIESHLDHGKGPVATILIQNGTLNLGDYVQVGTTFGRIRSMENHRGKKMKEAGPAVPVRIAGIKEVPQVASFMQVFETEKEAREESEKEKKSSGVKSLVTAKKIGIEEITNAVLASETKELEIVLKADVQGSLEAVKEALARFKTEEVSVKIVRDSIGDISEKDIMMATATAAKMIFGFNVGVSATILKLAEKEGVKISRYRVIYELLDDIKRALEALLPPDIVEVETGKLEVLKVFKIDKKETVFGGKVLSGQMEKGLNTKIVQGTETKELGKLKSLKREKDEVNTVSVGTECGLGFEGRYEIAEKDIVVQYILEERKRKL